MQPPEGFCLDLTWTTVFLLIFRPVQSEDVVGGEVDEIAWNTTSAYLLCVRFVSIGGWPNANIRSLTEFRSE